jgi:DEAD/DEAH box helicase domain-containing protein
VNLADLARSWAEDPDVEGELVHLEHVPGRGAIHADPDPPLHPVLAGRLAELGIERLYRHQVRAIEAIRRGEPTVVAAGTASGKTLCYQIPLAEAALTDHRSTALAVYPTKALAQDQLRSFDRLRIPGLRIDTYDGDTPTEARSRVRRHPGLVLTNPDMLHVGILPSHGRWADFFLRLRYVVVDEVHTLRGIYGTHVALVLRRLRRIARHYGSEPTFVFTSATIGNPGELASAVCGLPVSVVDQDDSPQGDRWIALWNPPALERAQGRRRSSLAEATDLFVDLVRDGHHTIAFARSRKGTELMYRWASERLEPEVRGRIAAYRGGYLPKERRAVEARLFSGELLGVIATNALELGIDVGGLDAAVVVTFPGTIAAFRQQAGRAGRSTRESLVTLVAGEDALDQYFVHHPAELFTRRPEAVVVNPSNPLLAEAHVACAAHELPLVLEDRDVLGEATEEAAARLAAAGHLRPVDGRLVWARRRRPAPQIDIRGSGGPAYLVVAGNELLGTLDEGRAFRDAHPGAIYLHAGETYLVEALDPERREVRVGRSDAGYYTQTVVETDLEVLETERSRRLGPIGHHLGRVRVTHQVVAFQRRRLGNREVLDTVPLDLPASSIDTQGIWLAIPDTVIARAGIEPADLPGTLHAAEHGAIAMLPLLAVCDRWDVGGLATPWHPATGMPTIFIHEGHPGGAGISPVVYERAVEHLRLTLEAIRSCPCSTGCPSCVVSPKCGNLNEPLSKAGAVRLLAGISRRVRQPPPPAGA